VARETRIVTAFLGSLAVIMVVYWTLWFVDRSSVASEMAPYYYRFEDAFPLADGLLTAWILLTAWSLARRSPRALLFGLMGTGAGLSLFCMDALFDLEHGIWFNGAGGTIEFFINVVTFVAATSLGGWLWRRRDDLGAPTDGRASGGQAGSAGTGG
jgi:hypothetical protein